MEEVISKLSGIQKEGLTEREFYSKVLEVIDGIKENDLTSENFERLKSTLLGIGCKDVDEWTKEQKEKGAPEIDTYDFDGVYKAVKNVSLYEAVNMVSSFLNTKSKAIMATAVILPGTMHSLAKEWCERNKMLYGPAPTMEEVLGKLDSINSNVFTERGFYEEVLKCLISTRNMTEMTPDMHKQIADKLREIGCSTVEEWKEDREKHGKTSEMYQDINYGVKAADVGTAVSMVERFFKSYDDAVELTNTQLAGEIPDALKWVNNSEEMRQAEISTNWMVQRLLNIDKSKMSEREFYQSVVEELYRGINPTLSRDMHKEIKDALEQIGVKSVSEWQSDEHYSPDKEVDGLFRRVDPNYPGSLLKGVEYASRMMENYSLARMFYEFYRVEPGRQDIKEWVEASKRIAPVQVVQASILGKMEERKGKQKELDTMVAEETKSARKTEEEVK